MEAYLMPNRMRVLGLYVDMDGYLRCWGISIKISKD